MSPRGEQTAEATDTAGAIRRSTEGLLAEQTDEGFWSESFAAGPALNAEYILLQLWTNPPENGTWNPPGRRAIARSAEAILQSQLPDGGFGANICGPAQLDVSIKAYAALKLAGAPHTDTRMALARQWILGSGGLEAASTCLKLSLSFFGLYPRERAGSIPPEILLMPGQLIYRIPAPIRSIAVPLSILSALDPRRPVPAGFNLDDLYAGTTIGAPAEDSAWERLSRIATRTATILGKLRLNGIRREATRRAEQWLLERISYSGASGATHESLMYVIMALDALGRALDDPHRASAERRFEALIKEPEQPSVRSTAIAAFAVGESGCASSLARTGDWLMSREAHHQGDWSMRRQGAEPSGWYGERGSDFCPDIELSATVLLAMAVTDASDKAARNTCINRAVSWLLAMQSGGGGWTIFDPEDGRMRLDPARFGGDQALGDPCRPDITGLVLEALCRNGVPASQAAVVRGVNYLFRTQEQDGAWCGGGDSILATCRALRGLKASGVSDREAPVLRAGEWLRSIQNADGGWGEDGSSPLRTSLAILGLLAGGDDASLSVTKGVEYLMNVHQGGLATRRRLPACPTEQRGRNPSGSGGSQGRPVDNRPQIAFGQSAPQQSSQPAKISGSSTGGTIVANSFALLALSGFQRTRPKG